ncbi:MAG: sigma-70 family RNA polymerase sigma factor [Rubrivivax sp.]|jgi:RNA polymerase sigma factor (sigma-70 family)|nr:sigma-70 family RNA polymerase sigma factor [Rubrivivax sp.]
MLEDLNDLGDDDLVRRCRAGSEAAWSTLVRRYQRLVYTVPRRAGLSDEACADVFQTTFARLVEHLDRIDDAARVRAWLVTTAKRESLRLLEAARRVVDLAGPSDGADDEEGSPLERIPDPGPLPAALLDELQQHHRLRTAVDRLDPRSRQFVELVFLQDEPLPYAEVARRLGIAEGSIGPTRARVLAKLRALMERDA